MNVEVKMQDFEGEVGKYLSDYKYDLTSEIEGALIETAEWGVKALKEGGPYQERTGAYSKDWDYRRAKKRNRLTGLASYIIYNKKHYRLTHLLENGHATRKGGRTKPVENKQMRVKAYPHIKAVDDMIPDIVTGLINKAVLKVTGKL